MKYWWKLQQLASVASAMASASAKQLPNGKKVCLLPKQHCSHVSCTLHSIAMPIKHISVEVHPCTEDAAPEEIAVPCEGVLSGDKIKIDRSCDVVMIPGKYISKL